MVREPVDGAGGPEERGSNKVTKENREKSIGYRKKEE